MNEKIDERNLPAKPQKRYIFSHGDFGKVQLIDVFATCEHADKFRRGGA